jgi:hypothetical protein
MNRYAIISALEDYWYKFYKDNPNEPMGDIPSALAWYRSLPMEQLLWEYNTLIG